MAGETWRIRHPPDTRLRSLDGFFIIGRGMPKAAAAGALRQRYFIWDIAESRRHWRRPIYGSRARCYPGVRLLAAHGGGYLPTYLGRSEHANAVRPEAREMARKPSDYLREMYFDTAVHDSRTLRHLINVVGASQVLLGTDYPFDMGHYMPYELVSPSWDAQERSAVLGGNARRLFGLP